MCVGGADPREFPVRRGGNTVIETEESKARIAHERNTLAAFYSPQDIPPSPKEPVEPESNKVFHEFHEIPLPDDVKARLGMALTVPPPAPPPPPPSQPPVIPGDLSSLLSAFQLPQQQQQLPPQLQPQPVAQDPTASLLATLQALNQPPGSAPTPQHIPAPAQPAPMPASISSLLASITGQSQPPAVQQPQQQPQAPNPLAAFQQLFQPQQQQQAQAPPPPTDVAGLLAQLTGGAGVGVQQAPSALSAGFPMIPGMMPGMPNFPFPMPGQQPSMWDQQQQHQQSHNINNTGNDDEARARGVRERLQAAAGWTPDQDPSLAAPSQQQQQSAGQQGAGPNGNQPKWGKKNKVSKKHFKNQQKKAKQNHGPKPRHFDVDGAACWVDKTNQPSGDQLDY